MAFFFYGINRYHNLFCRCTKIIINISAARWLLTSEKFEDFSRDSARLVLPIVLVLPGPRRNIPFCSALSPFRPSFSLRPAFYSAFAWFSTLFPDVTAKNKAFFSPPRSSKLLIKSLPILYHDVTRNYIYSLVVGDGQTVQLISS